MAYGLIKKKTDLVRAGEISNPAGVKGYKNNFSGSQHLIKDYLFHVFQNPFLAHEFVSYSSRRMLTIMEET